MKKILGMVVSCSLLGILISITSCKDDPPIKPKLSFSAATATFNEADNVVEIEVVLDRPALEDFTIDYEVSGTAQDEETATANTDDPDFKILEDLNHYGEIDIDKGETTGTVQIQLYSDFELEDDETIILKITEVDSELIEITRDDDMEIAIQQEDGLIVLLRWESTAVDLDLIIRYGTTNNTWLGVITGSLYLRPEVAFIPNTMDDGFFGLSYTYYEGTVDPLDFTASFIKVTDGVAQPEASWLNYKPDPKYTVANINAWTDVNTTIVVQTFQKTGSNWSNFSSIATPTSGSRVELQRIPSDPIKIKEIVGPKTLRH